MSGSEQFSGRGLKAALLHSRFILLAGFGGLLLPLWWLGVMFHVYALEDRVVPKEDEGEQY